MGMVLKFFIITTSLQLRNFLKSHEVESVIFEPTNNKEFVKVFFQDGKVWRIAYDGFGVSVKANKKDMLKGMLTKVSQKVEDMFMSRSTEIVLEIGGNELTFTLTCSSKDNFYIYHYIE